MVDIPVASTWELLFERPQRPFPDDHVLFRSASTTKAYTYNDVRTRAEKFGSALQHSSWQWSKGDVLMLMSPNSIETPSIIWGCHYAGGVVAPINPDLSASDLCYQLVNSGAKALVIHPAATKTALEAARMAKLPQQRVLVLDNTTTTLQTVTEFMSDAAATEVGCSLISPAEDLAYLVYSSGTTGKPKGVMVSHRNVVAAILLQSQVEGSHTDWRKDRTLAVLPVYHIYGLICLVHLPVWLGITTVLMEKFDLPLFCQTIQEHRITQAYVAPPIVLHLARNDLVGTYDLTTLHMLTSGGAPLASGLINEVSNKLGIPVRQAYGLSETTSVSHIQRHSQWQIGVGSNGPPLPGLEAKFMQPNGAVAAIKEEGELWIRGPTVFKGYLGEPAMTAESLTEDGWFKTGDIGFEDVYSNLYITDRSKDMIKYKGYQVAPAEIEDVLLKHPAVKDAAVIGIRNADLQSEVPLGYVTLKEGLLKDRKMALDILNHVKNHVIHYKQLHGGIIWTSHIPKSPSGKILKRVLREKAETVDKGNRIEATDYSRYGRAKI